MLYLSYKCIIPVLSMSFYRPSSSRRVAVDMGDNTNTGKGGYNKISGKGVALMPE